MPSITITKNYADGEALSKQMLDDAFDSVSTFLNTTKIDSENIQSAGVVEANLATGSVSTTKLAASAVTAAKLASDVTAQLVPAGAVLAFGGTSSPTGYLLCDGTAISRTTYSALFAAIGTAHGAGDGSTTFNLPDYRGRFLRGVSGGTSRDPNRTARTAMASGGNTGNSVGSIQGGATARPGTAFTTSTNGAHTHSVQGGDDFAGVGNSTGYFAMSDNQMGGFVIPLNGDHSHSVTGGGDDETRPLNAYVNYIIKT